MSLRTVVTAVALHLFATFACSALAAENAPAAGAQKPRACDGCGVVRSVRQIERPVPPRRETLPDMAAPGGSDSMNAGMQTMPQFTFGGGSGMQRVERQPLTRSAWEITVLYDNGQYGLVSVDTEPALQVGDRVRYFERNLELLPASGR